MAGNLARKEGIGYAVDSLGRGGRVWCGILRKRGQGVVWNPWEEGVGCGVDSLGRGGKV